MTKYMSAFILIFSLTASAVPVREKNFVVHGDPSSLGDSTHHSFPLPRGRKLIVDLIDNPGDLRLNKLTVSLLCQGGKRVVTIAEDSTVCGLSNVVYQSDDALVVHLTKYNAATGNCAGEPYTQNYSLLGKCKPLHKPAQPDSSNGIDGDADVFYPPQ